MGNVISGQHKQICIIGAGPTGLSMAKMIIDREPDAEITVLEKSDRIGGIGRTESNGNIRYDIGPHYYYSSNEDVLKFFFSVLPQEQFLSHKKIALINTMGRYFDYPIKVNLRSIRNLGVKIFPVTISWLFKVTHRQKNNLEDYFVGNYGKELYHLFFEKYTEKVWGIHPKNLPYDFLGQRNERDGIIDILKNTFRSNTKNEMLRDDNAQDFFLNNFLYPPKGSGQFWEILKDNLKADIKLNVTVESIDPQNKHVFFCEDGKQMSLEYDCLICTNPVIETLKLIQADANLIESAEKTLRFRGLITVNLELDHIVIGRGGDNNSGKAHYIYMHEDKEVTGRVTVFTNWSKSMAKNDHVSCCLEYYCNPNSEWFDLGDEELVRIAYKDLTNAGYIEHKAEIHSSGIVRVKNGYPITSDKAMRKRLLDAVRTKGIYSIGRLGSHEYISAGKCVEQALRVSREIWM